MPGKGLINNKHHETWKEILSYIIVAAVTTLLLIRLYHLYLNIDLSVPYVYSSDGLGYVEKAQNYINGGGLYYFPQMGAPFYGTMTSRPDFGVVYAAIFMLFSNFFTSSGFIINIIYLSTYPLVAVATFFALRQFGLNRILSAFGAVLYAYLPAHMYRNEMHMVYGNFFTIPIIAVLLLWIMKSQMYDNALNGGRFSFKNFYSGIRKKRLIFGICACFIFGMTDLYYAFFSCIFLVFAGIYVWVTTKKFRSSLPAIIFILFIIVGIGATLIPYFAAATDTSFFASGAGRTFGDSENYSLKLAQLLLPIQEHRIDALGQVTQNYLANTPNNTENHFSALGMIGAIGFLYSIFIVIFNKFSKKDEALVLFGKFNLFTVLLSIASGGGLFIAMFLTGTIRCYNRTSVFIGFFAIATICFLLQRLYDKIHTKGMIALFLAGVMLFGGWGIYDQTGMLKNEDFSKNNAVFYNDDAYVKKIESIISKDAMIFVLPAIDMESAAYNGTLNKIGPYEIRRLYLHSTTLRWSFSDDKGTNSSLWQTQEGTKPINEMVEDLAFTGFSGISVDKYGYTDEGYGQLDAKLKEILHKEPVSDSMNRYAFYDISDYVKQLRARYTDEEWKEKQEESLNIVKKTVPEIQGVTIGAPNPTNATGFAIAAIGVSSGFNPISRVEFVVTNLSTGAQKIYIGNSHGGGYYDVFFSITDFDNKYGIYTVDAYAYDTAGNKSDKKSSCVLIEK